MSPHGRRALANGLRYLFTSLIQAVTSQNEEMSDGQPIYRTEIYYGMSSVDKSSLKVPAHESATKCRPI